VSSKLLHLDPFAAAMARKEREASEREKGRDSSQPDKSSQPEKPAAAGQKSWQPEESSQPPEARLNLIAALPEVKGHAEVPYQIIDHLFRHLPLHNKAIYTQLYRLSWGWGGERCFISNPTLAARACLSLGC
jgi:hypothetical protein